ncbi:hypothetical protein [Inquilinus sp. CA228]|uniref:hypothetical protein n=1 Tax=Inquilinus sp. CA228 TaxID=3455609 RepID=UPI003F8D0436
MSTPLTHSARMIANVCDRADAMLDRVEAMIGKPVVGLCEACHELIVEGDEYAWDDNGMLLCGKLQGAPDAGPSCLDGAREEYVPSTDDDPALPLPQAGEVGAAPAAPGEGTSDG